MSAKCLPGCEFESSPYGAGNRVKIAWVRYVPLAFGVKVRGKCSWEVNLEEVWEYEEKEKRQGRCKGVHWGVLWT